MDGSGLPRNREDRPGVIYITYDGIDEPLGRSQVLAYLLHLARTCDIHLISFEKSLENFAELNSLTAAANISWIPLTYTASPPVLSTAHDVRRGIRAIRRARRELKGPVILHARSYVPALMAVRSGLDAETRFLFDIRGFWADERIEAGLWRKGSLYRTAKRYEREFFANADAVVTLTKRSTAVIEDWLGARRVPVTVIPTCVDLERFSVVLDRNDEPPRSVWLGSTIGWYDFEAGTRIADLLGFDLLVVTRDQAAARSALGDRQGSLRSAEPNTVPAMLRSGDVGLCTVRPSFSKIASAPTRMAEYLAAGMPVAGLSGVGDMDEILGEGVGALADSAEPSSFGRCAARLRGLVDDSETTARCRKLAAERFSLDAGIEKYSSVYRELLAGQRKERRH